MTGSGTASIQKLVSTVTSEVSSSDHAGGRKPPSDIDTPDDAGAGVTRPMRRFFHSGN